jgi:hypothetical protein
LTPGGSKKYTFAHKQYTEYRERNIHNKKSLNLHNNKKVKVKQSKSIEMCQIYSFRNKIC